MHTSKKTKKWFEEQKIEVLEWPALSPDLNPIENIWGILARSVYANRRQFNNRDDLIAIIQKTWNEIEPEFLSRLVDSMKNRYESVVGKKGDKFLIKFIFLLKKQFSMFILLDIGKTLNLHNFVIKQHFNLRFLFKHQLSFQKNYF